MLQHPFPDLSALIQAASGQHPVDLVLRNAQVINVFSAEIYSTDIAIDQGYIVGLGPEYRGRQERDLKGLYVAPGFIDGHVHIESSMVTVPQFARAVAACGTTSVICDPHEIANVLGIAGLRYMLESSRAALINIFFMLPSCVPATGPAAGLETSGAVLTTADLAPFIDQPQVLGIAEMMNFPGVIHTDPDVIGKLQLGATRGKRLDGHAPGLSGVALCAYAASGIASDHECTTLAEAQEKLRLGLHIMLREGTAAKNLTDLLPLITLENERRCLLVTDDRHPNDILEQGHIDFLVRTAIKQGLPPITAIRLATLNAAEYFHLDRLGAISPGYLADLLIFDSLTDIRARSVYKTGQLIAIDGEIVVPSANLACQTPINSVNMPLLSADSFSIAARGRLARVIGLGRNQLYTEERHLPPRITADQVSSDTAQDILKIAVIDRHTGTAKRGLGLVQGFGLKRGAMAASIAHDSHNIIAVAADDESLAAVVNQVAAMQGGIAVVDQDRILASLSLPIAGLMSSAPITTVSAQMNDLKRATHELGGSLEDPFMAMSFLALPVIPQLKITDQGLVDVSQFSLVDLFISE